MIINKDKIRINCWQIDQIESHNFIFDIKFLPIINYKCKNCQIILYQNQFYYSLNEEYSKLMCNEIIIRNILK